MLKVVFVDIPWLNIRKGPGIEFDKTGSYTGIGYFTISKIKAGNGSASGWGKLNDGRGWIALDFTTRV